MAIVNGDVKNVRGDGLPNVDLTFFNKTTGNPTVVTSKEGGYYTADLSEGDYVWVAVEDGYKPETNEFIVPGGVDRLAGPNIIPEINPDMTSPPGSSPPCGLLSQSVEDFLNQLDQPEFSIEAPISLLEANEAVGLFSVANIMLAGLDRYRVGDQEKIDMLGVLALYYGLADKSLGKKLVVQNSDQLWNNIADDLKGLAEELDRLQVDVDFLGREAKRQFNLGAVTSVVGNTRFPPLFTRYVMIATDPLVALNLESERASEFSNKAQVQEAFDRLRDLKKVIVEIVRSLSKYGTAATARVNNDWSSFERDALEVLYKVAKERVSDDLDEKTPWFTLSSIIERNRDEITPYIALGKHGTKLLHYAVQVYCDARENLDDTGEQHLVDLFQRGGAENRESWWTSKIRSEAETVKRYPLSNWG